MLGFYLYLFLPLLFLPIDSSSIRERNFKNDLVPSKSSRSESLTKDSNSLKVVSDNPFIIQLQVPDPGENTKMASKEADMKTKGPTKKRGSQIKPLKKRQRRDLQALRAEEDKETKSSLPRSPQAEKADEYQSKNITDNSISRGEILKALSSYSKKRETKKSKKDVQNFQEGKENVRKTEKYDGNFQKFSQSDRTPLVKMVYPTSPKTDKQSHKYTYKDLMADRERLEKKIKYIRKMLNVSTADDLIRVRRRSESDRTASKIAKMFLTLSAVNGLQDKLKSNCDAEDEEDGYRVQDVQDVWEKERQDSPSKRSSSSNEERYKVKKWIEHMKNKRSSSKTCPCMAGEQDEESDVFPLEQKLPKNYYLPQKGGNSEESSEALSDLHFGRDKPFKRNHLKVWNHKARDDHENKLKALAGRRSRKLELPLDDLELYRTKAKQILQNAEEILDKIKEEEEKRLSAPNLLLSQLKELTSRIQADPRNKENDLIKKIQKNLCRGLPGKCPDGTDGNGFLENVKSFILDPYEKAKAVTDESSKKLWSYLLHNLGDLQDSSEMKDDDGKNGKINLNASFGQVPPKKDEKLSSANLARENPEGNSSKSKEDENRSDTVSSALGEDDKTKKLEFPSREQEEQFKKRMEEMIKEQEKKLHEYDVPAESEEDSNELPGSVGNEKEKEKEDITEVVPKEEKVASPRDENNENENKSEIGENSAPRASDFVSEKEIPTRQNGDDETVLRGPLKEEVLEEIKKEIQDMEENVGSEADPEDSKSSYKEDEKDPKSSAQELTEDDKKALDVVAAAAEEETSPKDAINADSRGESDYDFLGSMQYLTEGSDQNPLYEADNEDEVNAKTKDPKEDELNEEKQDDWAMSPHLENGSPSDTNETLEPSTDITELGDEDALQRAADPLEMSQEQVQSEKDMESADLIQEPNPENSLEKTSEEKGEAEETEGEENLELGNPNDEYGSAGGETQKEDLNDEIPEQDQVSKSAVSTEMKASSSETLEGGNSNEGSDEIEGKALGDQEPESNFTDETPFGASANGDDQKVGTSEGLSEEVSMGQPSDNEEDVEAFQGMEKPTEEESAAEDETVSKDSSAENEETQSSSEDITPLKAAINDQKEKDEDSNGDDDVIGAAVTSQDDLDEKAESSEGSEETPLESALGKSQESLDKGEMETSPKAADSIQSGSVEDGETQTNNEVDDKYLKLTKPTADDKEESENLKSAGSTEVVSESQNEENSNEEEMIAKTADPTGGSNQKTETSNENSIGDTFTQEENPDEELRGEEDEDTVSRTSGDQGAEEFSSGEKRNQDETPDGEETVRAVSADQNQEDFDEGDEEESNLQAMKSNGETKMSKESSESNEADTAENVESALDVQDDENEDDDEETPLKEANNEAANDNLSTNEKDDDTPLGVGLAQENQEPVEEYEGDSTLQKEANIDDNVNENRDEEISLKAVQNKDDEMSFENDETPLRTANTEEMNDGEAEENTKDGNIMSGDATLKATIGKDDEEISEADETPLRAVNFDTDDEEARSLSTESGEETSDLVEDGEIPLRAENPEKSHQEAKTLENADAEETPLRAATSEELNNNYIGDEDETPLRSTMDSNDADSLKDTSKDASEESLRASHMPYDFGNEVDEEKEGEAALEAANPLDRAEKGSDSSYETLKEENPSVYSEESEEPALSTEAESSLVAAYPTHQTDYERGSEEMSSENLQKVNPQKKPEKAGKVKVPKFIAKIMNDLEGKDEISSIDKLNPEKIDQIMDKIDEAEEQNKVTDEVDCRKECACAEDIDTRSRNTGRYEIIKDFLGWAKDLHLNKVLGDD